MQPPERVDAVNSERNARDGRDVIVGRNQVLEALRAGRPVERLYVAKGAGGPAVSEIVELARSRGVVVQFDERRRLDRLSAGVLHQGVVAVAAPVAYASVDDLLAKAASRGEDPLLVALDEVQDPHNLGSLLRSVDGVGGHGVIVPKRRSVGLTMTVARTSAGAVEHVSVAQVSNLVQTLSELKRRGLWVVGADMAGDRDVWNADLTGPLVVVVGGEDKGLGRLTRETCDFLVRIPMRGRINSLNASVAGAIILFEVFRQRVGRSRKPGKG